MSKRKVYRYGLEFPGGALLMPSGATALHVDYQKHRYVPATKRVDTGVSLWAAVESQPSRMVSRRYLWVGTGHEVPVDAAGNEYTHVGSVLLDGGDEVWHIFLEGA